MLKGKTKNGMEEVFQRNNKQKCLPIVLLVFIFYFLSFVCVYVCGFRILISNINLTNYIQKQIRHKKEFYIQLDCQKL